MNRRVEPRFLTPEACALRAAREALDALEAASRGARSLLVAEFALAGSLLEPLCPPPRIPQGAPDANK